VLVAVPSTARAEGETLCDFTLPADSAEIMRVSAFQARLSPFLSRITTATTPGSGVAPVTSGAEADEAARSVLGNQFVMLWVDTPRQGWSVAFSPGPHDAASARAAIDSFLATRVSAADKDYLMGALTLLPTPYSKAELDAVVNALLPAVMDQTGILSGAEVSCVGTDVHVTVTVIPQETPEVRAQVDALVAPYGDKVRLRFGVPRPQAGTLLIGTAPELPPGGSAPAKPTPRLRDHVALPATARCVRGGTLTVKPGKDVRKLRLAAGTRKVVAGNGKAAKLKLKARRTKVAVTVTLKDGRTATQTLTYRRCA
jgi:hypothetical protein